jgi:hypothetical protein
MNKSVVNNIQAYISYFGDQVQSIYDHCPKTMDGDLHSRILYMALLDAISRSVFPKEENRERIVQFVSSFCGWTECERISLPHLYKLVGKKTEEQFQPLRNLAIRAMSKWIPAEKISLSRDLELSEVEVLWPRDGNKIIRIDGVWLKWLQHAHLLYTYRNSLMHEFRMPGRHVELWADDEPYYAHLIEYKDEISSEHKKSWELQYTAQFFRRLCNTGLTNLERHLTTNEIDPFKSIDWGNYWMRELNL